VISFLLSLFPRKALQQALFSQYRRSLPRHQRICLDYWGTPGKDTGHHPFQWADDLTVVDASAHAALTRSPE